jgi:hypothetical protein
MPVVSPAGASSSPIEIPEIGYATIIYRDPSGTEWQMTDTEANWFALADGVSGLGAAPVSLTVDPHPRGGARLRHVQPQPRTIIWPILVRGSDHTEFTNNWRTLAKAFTRTLRDGPGTLEVYRPDGSRRRVGVYYSEGFDGQGRHATGITWDTAVLTLWCEDPYWEDMTEHSLIREHGTGEDFLTPYPSVSSGRVLGSTTVHNPGDVIVWPTWEITGPASLITFTSGSQSFVLDPTAVGHGPLLAGETVTVSTDPPSVRYQDGSNWIGSLNWPGATLWGLEPGNTQVTFQLDGSADGARVGLLYYPRYETA